MDSKGPVFYTQDRLGKCGKIFQIIKFRTMVKNAEKIGTGLFTNDQDSRITKIGKLLRDFSIDELPQLVNIIKGDMSFVGPRPPVPYHPYRYEDYPAEFMVRFIYRPGMTGWAQVHGRTRLSWTRRLELDKEYHINFSFILDIKIFLRTILIVLNRENIYPEDKNIGKELIK